MDIFVRLVARNQGVRLADKILAIHDEGKQPQPDVAALPLTCLIHGHNGEHKLPGMEHGEAVRNTRSASFSGYIQQRLNIFLAELTNEPRVFAHRLVTIRLLKIAVCLARIRALKTTDDPM